MPLIRCPRCAQAYEVPGVIAVRLPNSIAMCHCGEWLAGSKAAVLARMLNPEQIREIDLQPYRVDAPPAEESASAEAPRPAEAPSAPRSIRIVARGAKDSLNTVFTIGEHPLWIGRRGSHVELGEADLSLRHCSIALRGQELVVVDAASHMGTFLDGQKITEATIGDGVHVLRVGSALVTLEPTDEPGTPVEPIHLAPEDLVNEKRLLETLQARREIDSVEGKRPVMICIEGALEGQEFEIPRSGLVIGREGHVRVPDEFLSRRHFEIVPHEDGFVRVRDLGSRNGTFLNTLPAHDTKVRIGDEIRAGVNRFRIEYRD